MSKVLYIGHYREGSGWSQAAIDYILCMDSVGIDIVPRSLNLNPTNKALPKRILELESKSEEGCDVCIQHILPHFMEYNSVFKKNIGLVISETSNFDMVGWKSHLSIMDELWVPNTSMTTIPFLSKSVVVPHPFNIKPVSQIKYNVQDNPEFVFYYIGTKIARKNVMGMLLAYLNEFSSNDNVSLILKSNIDANYINNIKKALRKYDKIDRYPHIHIINEYLTDEQISGMHNQFDCFLACSMGEAWNLGAFEAMANNKFVIATRTGGMADFLNNYEGAEFIESSTEPVFNAEEFVKGLHTSWENWEKPSVNSIAKAMRKVYNSRNSFPSTNNSEAYSYKIVGEKICELLDV